MKLKKKVYLHLFLAFLMWIIIGFCCSEMAQGADNTINNLCLSAWMLLPVFVLNTLNVTR